MSSTSSSLQCLAQKSAFLAAGQAKTLFGLQTTLQTLGVAATSTSLLSTQSTVPGLYTSVCTLNNSTGTCQGERSTCPQCTVKVLLAKHHALPKCLL